MSQQGPFQRNDYLGDINNSDGASVAGAVVNSGGGDIFIGSHPTRKGESDLLEKGRYLCAFSWHVYTHLCCKNKLVPSFSSSPALMSVDGGGVSGLSTLYVLGELIFGLNAKREDSASNIFGHQC
jgi:hypothetical protein